MDRRDRNILLGIVVLAFVLRIVCMIVLSPTREWVDSSTYDTLATQIVSGNGFTNLSGTPTRIRPPAYPLFIAGIYAFTGHNPIAATTVQALLGSLGVCLIYFITRRFSNSRSALTAALIAATYPALIFYDSRLLREGFTASVLVLGVLAAFRARERQTTSAYLLLGAVIGAASMCRPETVLLTAPLLWIALPCLRPFGRIARPVAIVLLTVIVSWTPWTVRNVIYFDSVSPVHAGLGSTVWFGSRWAENGGDDHLTSSRVNLQNETRSIQKAVGRERADSAFMARVLEDIFERPMWFLEMVGRKAILFWQDANGVRKTLPKVHPALPYVVNTYYYLMLGLAAFAAIRFRKNPDVAKISVTILCFAGTYAVLHVRNRYRIPILPMVFILSSLGFWGCMDWMAARCNSLNIVLTRINLSRIATR